MAAATGWTEAIISPQGAAGGCGWVGSLSAGSLGPPAGWALVQWQAVRGVGVGQEPGPEVPRAVDQRTMPCVSGGALADGTSACGLRPADQPAPTAPVKTISFVCFGESQGGGGGGVGHWLVRREEKCTETVLAQSQDSTISQGNNLSFSNQPQVSLVAHPLDHRQGN